MAAPLRNASDGADEPTVDVALSATGVSEGDWICGDNLEAGNLGDWPLPLP